MPSKIEIEQDYCHSKMETSPPPSHGWISPRVSFSFDFADENDKTRLSEEDSVAKPPSSVSLLNFEFLPEDSASMLPADELISAGKLLPLQLHVPHMDHVDKVDLGEEEEVVVVVMENGVVLPKAPRCSSRWKKLLGFKKQAQVLNPKTNKISSTCRGLKHFLLRNPKPSPCSIPLLRDYDSNPDTVPSRPSVDKENSDKPAQIHPPKPSVSKTGKELHPTKPLLDRAVSVNSPRINSSGKVVFQGLGRSSSSPSNLNGGHRTKNRLGMERSYSGSVGIKPVLNFPVCSLGGSSKSLFGLFSPQKKESSSGNNKSGSGSQ